MRIKRVKIGIKGVKEVLDDFVKTANAIEKGEKVTRSRGIYFENLATFRRALTVKRLEMLHVIKMKKPASVYSLCKMLGRDIKNVSDDLAYLEEIGLVGVKRKKEGRKESTPTVEYDRIDLQIAV